ncbi:MAG: sugar transferase [Candidatus Eremiobacteraeota bacterium]|nr:sugar transferase [Candidatus Eremiobacteraeota bacterium]
MASPMTSTEKFLKRALDLFLVFIGLLLTAPVMAAAALIIKLESKGPLFFLQERIGKDGKPFTIFKFRTMVDGAEHIGAGLDLVKGDPRITKSGHFLRRWCIDELPQLFNVLRGEMSCVGPRPTLRYQVEQYTGHERRRLEVKPGMTGLATVKGRNALSWPERIEWDIWYVDHYSFWLDIKLILATFSLLAKSDVVYADSVEAFRIRTGEEEDPKEPQAPQAPE